MDRKRFLITSAAGLVTVSASGCSDSTGPSGSMTIVGTSLPAGEVGQGYFGEIGVEGGREPYHWSVADGSLPPGLDLNGETGTITGTPSSGGEWAFRIKVTDEKGASAEQQFTLVIAGLRLAYGLYDDFDGRGGWQERQGIHLAVDGQLSPDLWESSNSPFTVVPSAGWGRVGWRNVLKMDTAEKEVSLSLKNPETVLFQDCQLFSADFMIPPSAPHGNFHVGLEYRTAVPDHGIGNWYCKIGLWRKGDENYIFRRVAKFRPSGGGSSGGSGLDTYEPSTWRTLGLGFEITPTSQLAINFYVDGEVAETFPLGLEDSRILTDPTLPRVGPIRSLQIWEDLHLDPPDNSRMVGYIDDVRADYLDLDLPPS